MWLCGLGADFTVEAAVASPLVVHLNGGACKLAQHVSVQCTSASAACEFELCVGSVVSVGQTCRQWTD